MGARRQGAGPVGVVVVDHGSRRDDANLLHESSVRGWGDLGGFAVVEPAHMELAEPSVATAFAACVAAGASTVVVAPYFLGPGTHWDRDLPDLAARAAAAHPGVRYLVAAPLGPHPFLGEILGQRVRHCLARTTAGGPECELCAGTGRCRMEGADGRDRITT